MINRFYRSDEEFRSMFERLKQKACPHCQGVGALILYGYLRGYDEDDHQRRSVRARRVFCNNRKVRNNGCGKTFSLWAADKVRRLSLNATSLWKFLKGILEGSGKIQSFRKLDCTLSDSGPYRIWSRFEQAQSKIRTELTRRCRPPDVNSEHPAVQVIAHLEAAFAGDTCPLIAFQHQTQKFCL